MSDYEFALLRSGLRAVHAVLNGELTEEQIERRVAIVDGVDAQACQRCETSALDVGAASDPAWFIDSEQVPNPSVPEEPVSLAIIFCPRCW